ncbi:hypothetical protein GTP46_24705 [Duganella sp. FT135W]|uniref:Uncharacterized protein n=1 Tax=Duganella flavida TaxID=2692175 RepID=A0A6L8KJ18_9BURK|nr:hypothetical protein [Duganella flavida]MYM25834.1 hypothetical protein [Duganella flavida]
MSTLPASTPFVNILVTVKPSLTVGKQWDVVTAPVAPIITEHDTVINYQIFDSGSYDIVFTGMTVVPNSSTQLSAASVSVSGKLLTFSDANTQRTDFNITLNFALRNVVGSEFTHDPQITNNPPS